VAACRGQIIDESLQDSRRERPTAHLTVRIPAGGAYDFLVQIESTSVVRSRRLNSRDVGKEYFDATLRVQSLEQVLAIAWLGPPCTSRYSPRAIGWNR
jgi:hypothetical protein